MYYKKPKNISYVDMCKYVDSISYKEDKTEEERETMYKYIYFISHMLAVKMHLFRNYEYYDDFAIWYTTQIFYRLENKKQYELDKNGNPKMTKIKSILNYIKSTITLRKVSFEQQEYCQIIEQADTNYLESNYSLIDKINDDLDSLYTAEFSICLNNCCTSIKKFLYRIPYKRNSAVWYNIYLSCLLSFLNSVTLSNKDIERIKLLKFQQNVDYIHLYNKENRDPVILYHLPDEMHDYVLVLLRQIKHELALELSQTSHSYLGTNSGLYTLMMAEINSSDKNDYGENN